MAMSDSVLSKTLDQQISSPNRVVVTPNSFATILVGFPELVSILKHKDFRVTQDQFTFHSTEDEAEQFSLFRFIFLSASKV